MKPILLFTSLFLLSFTVKSQHWDSLKHEKRNFFEKNTWSISTNLTSLYRPKRVAFSTENRYTTTNPYLTFEPELVVRKHFSLKFPIAIGLNRLKDKYEEHNDRNSSYYYSYPQGYQGEEPYFSEFSVYYHGVSVRNYRRYHDLIIQIGFYPKIYPFGKGKTTLYLSPGINFGSMDKYQIKYYHEFVKVDQRYSIVHEKMVYSRDPFLFLRKELLLGFDIVFSKSFTISLESGISSRVKEYGLTPDEVYQKLGDAPFELIYKDYTKIDMLPEKRFNGYLVCRFLVQYTIPNKKN
jgi:hypothetical protein